MGNYFPATMHVKGAQIFGWVDIFATASIRLKEKWQLKDKKSNNELVYFTFESLISFFYCILPFDRHYKSFIFVHLILTIAIWTRYYYSHFREEETEAQRDNVY